MKSAGKKLWDAAVADFEWAAHELVTLESACRIRDRIVDLDRSVRDDGLMLPSAQGVRLHPAIAEARQQRLALARLLMTLGLPALGDDDLPPSRRLRGFYSGGGG